jgi:FKBP-type peptidyl-prolyl cis-trans isomerase FkpA
MKKASLAVIIGATLVLSACGSDKKEEAGAEQAANAVMSTLNTETEKQSYALGHRLASFANEQVDAQTELGIEADRAALLAGFTQTFNGNSQFTDAEVEAMMKAFSAKFQAAEQAKNEAEAASTIAASQAYLTENGAKEGVVTTESGLQYEVMVQGDGAKPSATDTVRVHYHGTLIDGTVFDSSVDRGQPAEFPLNRVIAGWTEGVQLMSVGSKFKFTIPSEIAYGARGQGQIKPNSTLIFEVELLGIAPFED